MFLPIVMILLTLFIVWMLLSDLTSEEKGKEPMLSTFTLRIALILVALLDVLENIQALITRLT